MFVIKGLNLFILIISAFSHPVMRVTIKYNNKVITTNTTKQTVTEGQRYIIHCDADGNPSPRYTYYHIHNGVTKMLSTEKYVIISSANTSHTGTYFCRAMNSMSNGDMRMVTSVYLELDVVTVVQTCEPTANAIAGGVVGTILIIVIGSLAIIAFIKTKNIRKAEKHKKDIQRCIDENPDGYQITVIPDHGPIAETTTQSFPCDNNNTTHVDATPASDPPAYTQHSH